MFRGLNFFPHEYRNLLKVSWSVSWPMILIMFFEFIISITDVFIAGRLGKEYQAAVGFSMQVYFIFIVVANSITVGTVSVISKLYSSGKKGELSGAIYSLILSVIITGLFFGFMGVAFTGNIISFLNIPESVVLYAVPLARIYAIGLAFHYLLINSNGILRATGGVKKSLVTMFVVCILNVSLNFLMVFHTGLGFYGIALSTAVSVIAGAFINFMRISCFWSERRVFSWEKVLKIVRIGWPSGLQQISWQTAGTVLFMILSAIPYNNVEIIAAFTNGGRIESLIFLPAFALNMANAVIIGNFMGEGRREDAFRAGIVTALLAVAIIGVISIFVYVNAAHLAGMLSGNRIVIEESIRYIRISIISEPFMAMAVVLGGALNGAGDTRGVMKIIILGVWLVRIPMAFTLGYAAGFGAPSVWWSMNTSIFVYSFFILRRYLRRRWLEL